MSRSLTRLMPVVFLLLVSLAPIAYATSPTPANGNITRVSFTPTIVKNADGNTFIDFIMVSSFSGTFTGITNDVGTAVLRPTGDFTFNFLSTFNGTVDGKSGTVVFRVAGKGEGGTTNGTARGQFVILRGTGELANLHGQGSFEGEAGVATYSARIHFDPN